MPPAIKAPAPVRRRLVENEPLAACLLSVLVRGLGYEPVATADEALWALGNSAAPLPVDLVALTATAEGPASRLRWATASEQNSARFDAPGRELPAIYYCFIKLPLSCLRPRQGGPLF